MGICRRITCAAAAAYLLLCSMPVFAGISAAQYLSLRSKLCSPTLTLNHVRQDPFSFRGRTVEVRGTVQGIARNPEGVTLIISAQGGDSLVVSATKDVEVQSGGQVCALVTIGENCSVSLSDLRLAALAPLGSVVEKERLASEAQRLTQQKKAAASRAMTESRNSQTATNRGKDYAARWTTDDIYAAYRKAVAKFNKKLSPSEVDAITTSILAFSQRHNVDPRLVMAVILAESHFNPDATSRCGAQGLGQLMPGTARGLGVSNAYDPVANIEGAVRLLKGHISKYAGSKDWNDVDWSHIQLALASYNAGPGAVKKYGGIPPYRETQGYVRKVISYYKELCGIN